MLTHREANIQSSSQVIFVVLQRLGHTFADRLERCKMNHRIKFFTANDLDHRITVAQIGLMKFDALASQLFNSLQRLLRAVDQAVDHSHLMATVKQFKTGVAANISSATSYQNVHELSPESICDSRL